MEDVSARGKAGPGDVRRQLERAREPDTYDLEAGLRRHRELVARGAPPPAWAEGMAVRPRVGTARWFMGLSALMMGAGVLWAGQRDGTSDPLPLTASTTSSEAATGVRGVAATGVRGEATSGAPGEPKAVLQSAPREPSVAPPVIVEPAAAAEGQPAAPVQGGVPAEAPMAAEAVAEGSLPTAPSTRAPEASPPVVAERSSAPLAAPAAAGPASALSAAERAPRGAPHTGAPSRWRPSEAPPAPVPEPTLAELARQSVASAESAPSVPASRPAVATAPARAVDPLAPPAGQAAPRHLVIEAERPGVVAEMQELARAEALLARDPAQALKLVQASMAEHPQGYLREERRYVEVLALLGLRRVEEARLLGREFARLHPQSPYRRRVEAAIATALRAQ
jgi:hypothetical protein